MVISYDSMTSEDLMTFLVTVLVVVITDPLSVCLEVDVEDEELPAVKPKTTQYSIVV